ncbi:MAG: citrate transporter [Clostridia bacterium]|nr:citrate transporter [Clostridia bacterium]
MFRYACVGISENIYNKEVSVLSTKTVAKKLLRAPGVRILRDFIEFVKKNAVMCIAFAAASVTTIFVPVDKEYLGYFDFKTLTCLFCVLAVVCALKNIRFFYTIAEKIVICFKNARMCVLALVYITFLGSMLIANDMALLTFLPLGYFVLSATDKRKYMAVTFILQNIAANLGGMLTPFGNPQNLYLYSKFSIPNMEFIEIMLTPFLISVVLITLCCIIFVKPEPLEIESSNKKLPLGRTILYLCLFALSIAIVFRGIPYWIGLVVIPLVLLFADRDALKKVDYPLLLTFVFFFVFAGNMARIELVRDVFSYLMDKSTLLFSVLSCQIISNVPSAILLSQFTDNYRELLLGVNIGGVGTLIASLASLITFREYTRHNPDKTSKYIKQFSAFNFAFLIILTSAMLVITAVA